MTLLIFLCVIFIAIMNFRTQRESKRTREEITKLCKEYKLKLNEYETEIGKLKNRIWWFKHARETDNAIVIADFGDDIIP